MPGLMLAGLVLAVAGATAVGYLVYRRLSPARGRLTRLSRYWDDPQAHSAWAIQAGARCGQAPFVMPTSGLVGFYWGDTFQPGRRHQGIDIFGPTGPSGLGQTPVVAAYDGYLTRLPSWRSAVIIRIPSDPLRPGRQIWTYYAHMADPDGNSFISVAYPAGTTEQAVRAGTLLGYQGNYSADPGNPTGMHLHFSIVLDDGRGGFRNELDIGNTLDPSAYLGIEVYASRAGNAPAVCPGQAAG
jgi:murein DD-endopeptidase MepM/ murein hydrolase activator NlpD